MRFKFPSPDLEIYRRLLAAYRRCLVHKSQLKKTKFHVFHEQFIYSLALEIENRTYKPLKSNIFIVSKPKYREVIAAHLRDRIVHHFLYEHMAPYWEARFVYQSYACRPGKGPLMAGRDLETFVRHYYRGHRDPLYYLKVDVQSFFPSIDHRILKNIVDPHLQDPLYKYLLHVIIDHRATERGAFHLTSPQAMWQHLPRYKSMFAAPLGKGLPIGNLTSQFLANVYMNELDQYITHHLKGRYLYWQRYVDDVVFLGDSPRDLLSLVPLVQGFLNEKLGMTLNPKKTEMQPLSRGLDHLGYFYRPDHRLVRQRVVSQCKERVTSFLRQPELPIGKACATVNSYLGHFAHAHSLRLRKSVVSRVQIAPQIGFKVVADASYLRVRPVVHGTARSLATSAEHRARAVFCERFVGRGDLQPGEGRTARVMHYLSKWRPIYDLMAECAADLGVRAS